MFSSQKSIISRHPSGGGAHAKKGSFGSSIEDAKLFNKSFCDMPKFLVRLVALILLPSLLMEPAVARGVPATAPHTHLAPDATPFSTQAITAPLEVLQASHYLTAKRFRTRIIAAMISFAIAAGGYWSPAYPQKGGSDKKSYSFQDYPADPTGVLHELHLVQDATREDPVITKNIDYLLTLSADPGSYMRLTAIISLQNFLEIGLIPKDPALAARIPEVLESLTRDPDFRMRVAANSTKNSLVRLEDSMRLPTPAEPQITQTIQTLIQNEDDTRRDTLEHLWYWIEYAENRGEISEVIHSLRESPKALEVLHRLMLEGSHKKDTLWAAAVAKHAPDEMPQTWTQELVSKIDGGDLANTEAAAATLNILTDTPKGNEHLGKILSEDPQAGHRPKESIRWIIAALHAHLPEGGLDLLPAASQNLSKTLEWMVKTQDSQTADVADLLLFGPRDIAVAALNKAIGDLPEGPVRTHIQEDLLQIQPYPNRESDNRIQIAA
jgi:hypothetical protein